MWYKKWKKRECFGFDIFGRSEKNREGVGNVCQTPSYLCRKNALWRKKNSSKQMKFTSTDSREVSLCALPGKKEVKKDILKYTFAIWKEKEIPRESPRV
jgi:hypothetical protein